MLMNKVLAGAQDALAGKTVKDIVVGISLTGVELSDGSVGIAYVLRDGLPNGCSVFSYVNDVCGKPAAEIAQWAVSGTENVQRAVGTAVLTAASNALELTDDTSTDIPFDLDLKEGDTVGMIGYIRPVAKLIAKQCKLIVFDEGVSLHGGDEMVCPMEQQAEMMPKCDIVVVSGTTTINGSIDSLLDMCKNARQIVMVGPSTPMYPESWKGTGVTGLAGALWDNSKKDEIFRAISLGNGVSELNRYMIKKNVKVK